MLSRLKQMLLGGQGGMEAKAHSKMTISARVIRRSGEVEDLGVIYEGEVKKNGKSRTRNRRRRVDS